MVHLEKEVRLRAASDTKQYRQVSLFPRLARLLEQSIARLLKLIKTDLPARESTTTTKARRAADTRWRRQHAAG